jgi:hypothetical protein
MYKHKLFSTKVGKILKGKGKGYYTIGLFLAPSTTARSTVDLCKCSTSECEKLCLNTAGNGSYPSVQQGRINKTIFFIDNQLEFMERLHTEITFHLRKAEKEGFTLCIRMNGTQDVLWEKIKLHGLSIFEHFPKVIFYDYTKWPPRKRNVPKNVHLTYSYTGKRGSKTIAGKFLLNGGNIAFVYDGTMPKSWFGFPVLDGDTTDLRFLDRPGHAIALKAKGKARGKSETMDFVNVYA